MAAADCAFLRTLTRFTPEPRPGSRDRTREAPPHSVCRDFLFVLELRRYSRDLGSAVLFPHHLLQGPDLYDVVLSDGDCRLRVSLDPGLNQLVERRVLRVGAVLRNAAFSPAISAQIPACSGADALSDSFRLVRVEVSDWTEVPGPDPASLPWFGSSEPQGAVCPLGANRSVFLPLWNNVDYSGEEWRDAPPPEEEEEEEEEEEARRPTVSVSELRDSFLIGRRGVAKGTVQQQLIIRIINKSHLMYYGKPENSCECPYKVVLEVCDLTGSVCVVLWNSVCVRWYCHLKSGDIISLRRFRVKRHYQAEPEDIEISVNSRNPAAQICVLPESSVSAEHLPPAETYSFCNSKELSGCPHGTVCDVIGLLTFTGRRERIRSGEGSRGAGLQEYLWLRLEDGNSKQPIMVKLFSTSQPGSHDKLHPRNI
ncbi:hypothetical protein PBY51_005694 [Eleginops maclovinus]|uniref:RPA-related protein RADX-like n=1 Tax=Eleginops maclovinus TaxID=56733 RepID=A0AAN8A9N2_ELEMC|nr:hypothetical protein PBY51_005694 [Eleginops maclovinus]